jgi:HD superfamily phosphohydrolase
MEIRDVIHGVIKLESHELAVLDSVAFQRLRSIKAMGFAEHSYPGASHNRYIHSLGAMHTASTAFDTIFKSLKRSRPEAYFRYRAVVRLAALLHDIGHGPFSHTCEPAMPEVSKLGLAHLKKGLTRQATHEDYTLKILLDSSLTGILEKAGSKLGFKPQHIAALIDADYPLNDSFFSEKLDYESKHESNSETVNFRPIFSQLISSELDADRMDYLRRDSYFTGVSYGVFDDSWIISNLCLHVKDSKCFLALKHRALYAFEDFLLSRFHMFLMVYLHHKTVIYDEMLAKFLSDPQCDYQLPADIDQYLNCTDVQLYNHLSSSKNPWAKRIVNKNPYRMLLETHSGIPGTEGAKEQQEKLFKKTLEELQKKKVSYIESKSTGVLSKYFGKSDATIYVRYDNLLSEPSYIPLQKCTPLFTQYPSIRSISRIFVEPNDYSKIKSRGRETALDFE